MKQIIQNARTGKLAQVDVPAPAVRPGHLLVRTTASLISAGTERMVIDFARKSLAGKAAARPDLVQKVIDKARRDGIGAALRAVRARLDQPLPLGYSAAGTIIEVGAGLEGEFRVGQRIAIAGAGVANHAEYNLVPGALAAPVPDDVPDEQAAFGTLAAIALHGVRNLRPQLGDIVAVIGAGLVGQLTVQLLALSGARVVAIDSNPARLALARQLGAEVVFDLSAGGLVDAVLAFTRHRGCDGLVIAAASDSAEPMITAAAIARDRARVSMVGKVGTEFPFADYMKKELEIVVSRSYGPGRYDDDFETRGVKYPAGFVRWTETENLAECLRLMSPSEPRRLDATALITHRFDFADAEKAYALVVDGVAPSLGVVLTYDTVEERRAPAPTAIPAARPATGHCTIGVIGAGVFARSVLLPILKDISGATLKSVVTSRGATAAQVREAFGFARAAAEIDDVLGDPQINAVVIATPHNSHAELVARALAAGKHVFVEKPLAISRAEVDRVRAAREAASGFFAVGFNRRFAPLSRTARTHLDGRPGPRMLSLRINAGPPPREGWMSAPSEGGGRILGEVCHFVDLAQFLASAPIETVHAAGAQSGVSVDDVVITLGFANGSVASITYTGLGDSAYPKELIEAYAAGTVVKIDDFRRLVQVIDGRETGGRAGSQDKGHRAELAAFVDAVRSGGPAPADESEAIAASVATLAIVESLSTGRTIHLT